MTASGARPGALCSRRLRPSPASWKLPERFLKLPKQETETLSSAASPIFSRADAELWTGESPKTRDGELARICSLADRDHDGLMQFSLTASGLVTEDLDDRLCRCTLRTNGRVEKPPGSSTESRYTMPGRPGDILGRKQRDPQSQRIWGQGTATRLQLF